MDNAPFIMRDRELLEKLSAGDIVAYKHVFESYYKNLVKYANRFLNDVESSTDLVQEVFCYIWEKRSSLAIERSMEAYLYRAVHNACINHIRKNKLKANYIREFLLKMNSESDRSQENSSGYEYLVEQDMAANINQIMESLPVQCSNIFKLSRYRGLKNQEIADLYKISIRTVETQIFRALKVFKEKLQQTLILLALLKIF